MSLVVLAEPLAKSGEAVKAGPIGLAVILIMCIACYFLFKSMSKHMRNVRENFPAASPPGVAPPGSEVKTAATTADETDPKAASS
ncbi:MAG: hypothetical protein M3Y06_05950 [Actinomycetota bacterium]|nr:hypothetical protein [Actinomycetota bacterium]